MQVEDAFKEELSEAGKPILKLLHFDISQADDISGYSDEHAHVVVLSRGPGLSDSQLSRYFFWHYLLMFVSFFGLGRSI